MEEGIDFDNLEEQKEVVNPKEIVIKQEVINKLKEETKRRSLGEGGEFLAILLSKDGVVCDAVSVGFSAHDRVIGADMETIIESIAPYLLKGLKVTGDYHNHTNENIEAYTAAGYSPSFAVSPSASDLDLSYIKGMQEEFGLQSFPRIIGAYLKDRDEVILSGVNILREYSQDEEKQFEIPDPFYVEDEPDDLGIKLLQPTYTNPVKLLELGVIEPIKVNVENNGSLAEIPNPLLQK